MYIKYIGESYCDFVGHEFTKRKERKCKMKLTQGRELHSKQRPRIDRINHNGTRITSDNRNVCTIPINKMDTTSIKLISKKDIDQYSEPSLIAI